jgi:hypothetical protein
MSGLMLGIAEASLCLCLLIDGRFWKGRIADGVRLSPRTNHL